MQVSSSDISLPYEEQEKISFKSYRFEHQHSFCKKGSTSSSHVKFASFGANFATFNAIEVESIKENSSLMNKNWCLSLQEKRNESFVLIAKKK